MSSQNQANVVFIKCSCGRSCKGRRGLKAHQRSCAVHNTLSAHNEIDRNSVNLELVNSDSTDVTAMDQISDQASLRDINYSDSADVAANDHNQTRFTCNRILTIHMHITNLESNFIRRHPT